MRLSDLDTPAVTVDLSLLQSNIARLQAYLSEHGLANRPHIKTHKIPEIAHMQMRAGAVGITCQKLSEAEVMAQAGLQDIFVPYNIVGEAKLERLVSLARRVRLSVTADSEFTVRGLSATMKSAGLRLPVLVEFDTGHGRCGVQSPQEAADLARVIARSPGLQFAGLMTYPHNENTGPFVAETKRLMASASLTVERVSIGGTPQMWRAHTCEGATEYRAGIYVYGDRHAINHGAMRAEECSLRILTTVVSRPTTERGILDGGSKTFSSDLMGLEGHGLILEYPEAKFYAMTEEHGHVDFSACPRKPEIGERVTVIPNHSCQISNLADRVYGVRHDVAEVSWPVAARGTVQ